jgi:uncharacterized protein (DUF2141 family)
VVWQSKSALPASGQGFASQVAAADPGTEVAGLRNTNRILCAAVGTEEEFLRPACARFGSAPASAGAVTGVLPGTYGVQVVHDENDNRTPGRPAFLPTEGMGSSRDAPMRFRPPVWEDARFELTEGGATVALAMRYFQ